MWNSKKYLAMAVVGAGLAVAAASPASAQGLFGFGLPGLGGQGMGFGSPFGGMGGGFPGNGGGGGYGGQYPYYWPTAYNTTQYIPWPMPIQQPTYHEPRRERVVVVQPPRPPAFGFVPHERTKVVVVRVGGGSYGCAPRPVVYGCAPRASACGCGCGAMGRGRIIPRDHEARYHSHAGHAYASLHHGHVYASAHSVKHHYAAKHGYSLKLAA